MKISEYLEKLETIKYLIEHKRAGTPHVLSQKLGISERTLDRMIRLLKDQGYPITYNHFRRTYELNYSQKNTGSATFWRCVILSLLHDTFNINDDGIIASLINV